jgi:hypothetical protein
LPGQQHRAVFIERGRQLRLHRDLTRRLFLPRDRPDLRRTCRGDDAQVRTGLCVGIGGVRVDRAVAAQLLEAVSIHAIDAAIAATERAAKADDDVREALSRELEEARYEADLAAIVVRGMVAERTMIGLYLGEGRSGWPSSMTTSAGRSAGHFVAPSR